MTKVALVTGGSGGIGRAAAIVLGREYDVVVHCHRNREAADSVTGTIEDGGRSSFVYQCDITKPDAVEKMVGRIRETVGGIDILVNCAGVLFASDIEETSDELIQQTIRTNLEGPLYCVRSVLPDMLENGAGWIVNVSSTAGIYGSSTDVAYGASKGGLIGLTKSLAKQYTERGIYTNAVAPSATDTSMYAEDRRPTTRKRSPISRLISPEEVAEAIVYFSKTTAISGDVLTIDGAIHLQ